MSLKVKFIFFLAFVCVTLEVKGEIGTWFRQSHDHGGAASNQHQEPHPEHKNDASKMSPGWKPPVTPGSATPGSATPGSTTPDKVTPLHEILNATKGDMHKARRDASSAAAAQSTTTQQTFAAPPPVAAAPLPAYPYPPAAYPYPPFGGFFPGFGGGAGAGLNIGVDAGIGAGAGGYFPIIEKVIVIVGGGILILIFLAIIQAIFTKGGLGRGFDKMFGFDAAKSFAGSVDVNAGPFHASKSASGSVAFDQNAHLTQRVMNGVNQRW